MFVFDQNIQNCYQDLLEMKGVLDQKSPGNVRLWMLQSVVKLATY